MPGGVEPERPEIKMIPAFLFLPVELRAKRGTIKIYGYYANPETGGGRKIK